MWISSVLSLSMVTLMVTEFPTANGQFNVGSLFQTLQGSLSNLGVGAGARSGGSDTDGVITSPRGSRVGPFFLFRSSADNAAIVNEAFRGMPIPRSTFLAIGDEFPKLRDDFIEKTRSGNTQTPFQRALAVATNIQNWSLDRENNKKEMEQPFIRPSRQFVNSLIGSFSGGNSLLSSFGGNKSKEPSSAKFRVSLQKQPSAGVTEQTEKAQKE